MYSLSQRPDLLTEYWDQPAGRRGGDFVVCVRTPATVRIVLGDVAGHGDAVAPRAALIRRLIERDLRSPVDEDTFCSWNQTISFLVPPDGFVCLTYLEVDPDRRTVRIANAGNPAVLLRRADGRVESFSTTGMILGAVEDEEWRAPRFISTRLECDDAVLCFTDGLIERTGLGREPFGLGRVVRAVALGSGASPVSSIRRWLDAFCGCGQCEQDDLSVLCVRCQRRAVETGRIPFDSTLGPWTRN